MRWFRTGLFRQKAGQRFAVPLELSVRFRSFPKGSLLFGAGLTAGVSSGGVLVVSEHVVSRQEIEMGALVEMRIEWPPHCLRAANSAP